LFLISLAYIPLIVLYGNDIRLVFLDCTTQVPKPCEPFIRGQELLGAPDRDGKIAVLF
jgi:hypothetical protein